MSLEKELELTKKAVDNNELKKIFLGESGHEWGNLKHIPALVLTDIKNELKQLNTNVETLKRLVEDKRG